MGRKINPVAFRIGVIRDWQSKWYADKEYAASLQEDLKIRQAIQSSYIQAGISLVQIERQAHMVSVTIHTARPGVVIGRGGQRVDKMKQDLEALISKKIQLNIQEIQQPELDAHLVAETIAGQIENRIAYRRAMKQAISRSIMAGAQGIKVSCSGRLGGAEIARRITMHEGRVPLQTLRADVDYGFIEARTTLGRIGVKVWLYRGEIFPEREIEEIEKAPPMEVFEKIPPEMLQAENKPRETVEVEERTSEAVGVSPEPEPTPTEVVLRPEELPSAKSTKAVPEEKAVKSTAKKTTKKTAATKEKAVKSTAKKTTKKTAATKEKAVKSTAKKTTKKTAATKEKAVKSKKEPSTSKKSA